MKPVTEWLEKLPWFIREKAIENFKTDLPSSGHFVVPNMSEAVRQAFTWDKTPQGFEYWNDIYQMLQLLESK
jgi:hypothetical protein